MSDFAMEFLWRLGTASIFLAVGGAVAIAILRLCRVQSPRVHGVVWWLVLLQGVLIFQIKIDLPWLAPVSVQPSTNTSISLVPMELPVLSEKRQPVVSSPDIIAIASDMANRSAGLPWSIVLLAAWGGGVVFIFCRWIWHYSHFLRECCGEECDNRHWSREWKSLLEESGFDRKIPLYVSSQAGPVLCWSLAGYRLVVPFHLWNSLLASQRRLIMRHELIHVARFDVWKSLVSHLVATIHWINPIAWLASRRIEMSSEWACDDAVANDAGGEAAATYATTLLAIAEAPMGKPAWKPAAGGGCLSTRIRRIVSGNVNKDSKMKTTLPIILLLVVALVNAARIELTARELNEPQASPEKTATHQSADGAAQGGVALLALDFSRDGSMVAVGGDSLRLYDTKTGRLLGHRFPPRTTRTVAFSPTNADLLVTGGDDGMIRFWDVSKQDPTRLLKGQSGTVFDLAFSPNGKLLASADCRLGKGKYIDGQFRLWNVESGEMVRSMKFPDRAIKCVAFSRDGSLLAFCRNSSEENVASTIEVYNVKKWKLLRSVPFSPGFAMSVCFTDDGGKLIITGGVCVRLSETSCMPTGRIWFADLKSDDPAKLLNTQKSDYFRSACLTLKGDRFATGTATWREDSLVAEIQLRDVQDGKLQWSKDGEVGDPYGVTVSPDGKILGCCTGEKILMFDTTSGALLRSIHVPR